MGTPLLPVQVLSIYALGGQRVPMPRRMALATPDLKMALFRLAKDVGEHGGSFALSDLYRSYDMQLQAHMDYVSRKKKAFSPAPGASMHEAGRAFDVDLKALKMPLQAFWNLAERCLVVPILSHPDEKASEAWHFECRGSHQKVYDYYKAGKGRNFNAPAAAMAASAIVATGVQVDRFAGNLPAAQIQSALIRLGQEVGNLDGAIGPKCREALARLQLDAFAPAEQLARLEHKLQEAFLQEYFDQVPEITLDD